MTSLVSVSDVRALINTGLSNASLQDVIDRIEAEITAKIGAPQNDALSVTVTKTLSGGGENLFFPTELAEVVSAVEHYGPGNDATLDADDYQIWGGGVLQRLAEGGVWAGRCVVVYKPADDRPQRRGAIIDLVRIELNRTAMKSESIAEEYSFTAPDDWEKERKKIFRRLMFVAM